MTSKQKSIVLPGENWSLLATLIVPFALAALIAHVVGSAALSAMLIELFIRVVAVVAIYIFSGNSGILSFGHVAFMGIGAYASTWQTCCPAMRPIMMHGLPDFLKVADWPVIPAAIYASMFAALVAFVAGLVILRLQSVAAIIATFALLFIFNSIYGHWDSVTMGISSVIGLPQYVTPIYAWTWLALTIAAAFAFQNSSVGLMLRAARDEDSAARACGVPIYWLRVLAFTISGFFSGMAGVLLAHHLGTISIDTFYLDMTFMLLAMLVVGGLRSLSGAVAGAVVVSLIIEVLRQFQFGLTIAGFEVALPPGSVQIGVALAMLFILIYRRDGLMMGREFAIERFLSKKPKVVEVSCSDSQHRHAPHHKP
jgi:branched-chain amino acid transport system permease protein